MHCSPERAIWISARVSTEVADSLSVTRLNFASQRGVRFPLPDNRAVGELTFRHWSNGGIRLPNHGQDFVTLTVSLNPGAVGVDWTEEMTINREVRFKGTASADDAGTLELP
jgi:Lipid A 3-O-deacylase (PagL)